MKPANWVGYVSLLAVVTTAGSLFLAAGRLDTLSNALASKSQQRRATDIDTRARIDDIAARLSVLMGHTQDRRLATMNVVKALKQEFVLVIGDSITEWAELPDHICSLPVVNAGIGGARVSDFLPLIEDLFSTGARPTITVVALGVNDTQARYWTRAKGREFRVVYDALLNMVPDTVMAVVPTAIEPQKIAGRYSSEAWSTINSIIRESASKRKATLIDVGPRKVAAGTIDGVHLNDTSYEAWRGAIELAIKNRLGC